MPLYLGHIGKFEKKNEHSEKARAPYTHESRDVPRCGALNLLHKPLHHRGIKHNSCPAFLLRVLAQLLPAPAFRFARYLIVMPRPLPAAALVVRRRYLIVVPRPVPAAPRKYLIVVPRPLSAAPHAERRRYMIVVPRPIPAAPRMYLIVVPRLKPTAPRRYLIVVPRRYELGLPRSDC
jgi:hypothetical protein